jgi:hypothetical protein
VKLRATLLCLVLLGCLALPAGATASKAKVFKMTRADMRITLNVKGDRVVRAHVRARERCGNDAGGFLEFDLPRSEAIEIRDGSFDYDVAFDDARGHGRIALEGGVNPQTIRGVFLFRNFDDLSCGSGRPGYRRVLYTARLQD